MKRRDFVKTGITTTLGLGAGLTMLQAAGNDGTAPGGRTPDPSQMPPTVPVTPLAPATSTTPVPPTSTLTAPPINPNQVHDPNGYVFLPRRNHIPVPATERAVLMSLNTEQRDIEGNILRDAEGHPIMVPVREGMNVFKGQVLGNFDDRELHSILRINQAQLDVAIAERNKEIEVEVAARSVQVAMADLQRMEAADRQHARVFSATEIERARLVVEQARANLALQQYTIDEIKTREVVVRESELERTKVQIELRKLVAPIDGMIVKVNAAEGEWKREGDPILEIMQLETVWIRARVNAGMYAISDLDGKRATVQARLPNGSVETFQGAVVFCDPTIIAGNQYEVYAEIQNRRIGNYWLLQPGRDGLNVVIQL